MTNGIFYKVYVIGDEVMVFQRPSLPNLSQFLDSNSNSAVNQRNIFRSHLLFDSRYNYPILKDFIHSNINDKDIDSNVNNIDNGINSNNDSNVNNNDIEVIKQLSAATLLQSYHHKIEDGM